MRYKTEDMSADSRRRTGATATTAVARVSAKYWYRVTGGGVDAEATVPGAEDVDE